MSTSAASTLAGLKDIGGVVGSFYVSRAGEIIVRDMPSLFDDELMMEVAPRVQRMSEGLPSDSGRVESCLIRYADHLVFLRMIEQGTFGVLAQNTVNLAALKMAVNLTLRRIGSLQPEKLAASVMPASSVMTSAPPPAPAPTASTPPQTSQAPPLRRWRGSLVPKK